MSTGATTVQVDITLKKMTDLMPNKSVNRSVEKLCFSAAGYVQR